MYNVRFIPSIHKKKFIIKPKITHFSFKLGRPYLERSRTTVTELKLTIGGHIVVQVRA